MPSTFVAGLPPGGHDGVELVHAQVELGRGFALQRAASRANAPSAAPPAAVVDGHGQRCAALHASPRAQLPARAGAAHLQLCSVPGAAGRRPRLRMLVLLMKPRLCLLTIFRSQTHTQPERTKMTTFVHAQAALRAPCTHHCVQACLLLDCLMQWSHVWLTEGAALSVRQLDCHPRFSSAPKRRRSSAMLETVRRSPAGRGGGA